MQNPEHPGKSWWSNIEILLRKLEKAWKAGVKSCTKDGFCGKSSQGTPHSPLQRCGDLGLVLLIHLSSWFVSGRIAGKPSACTLPVSTPVSQCG